MNILPLWIQPRHLSDEAIEGYSRRFHSTPLRYVTIDDFLIPERLPPLRQLVLEDGQMALVHKIQGNDEFVDEETFEAAPEGKRFFRETNYQGPKPGREKGVPASTHKMFAALMQSAGFHQWMSRVTGQPIKAMQKIILTGLGRNHFLGLHSDRFPGRRACAVLYLHQDWREEYGGRFVMHGRSGSLAPLDPVGNRLLIFDPDADEQQHEVEKTNSSMGDWVRMNYTIWFT